MIEPGQIPQIAGDIEAVAMHGQTLKAKGKDFADTGLDVHATWQGLSAFYRAPEAPLLFSATVPVKTKAAHVGADLAVVGDALVTYADAVRPLRHQLDSLKTDAEHFRASAKAEGDVWRMSQDKVDEHNRLLSETDAAVAAWMAAQRTCANTINALFGGTQYVQDNGDGTPSATEYGYSAKQLDQALRGDHGLPWGKPEERDKHWYEDVFDDVISFDEGFYVDGVWGDLKGLGNLVGFGGWDGLKRGWTGIYELSILVNPLAPVLIGLNQFTGTPGLKKGQLLSDYKNMGKGLLDWDEWKKDPARALGNVTWNVVSIVFGSKGTGAALKIGKVGELSEKLTATVGRVTAKVPELKIPSINAASVDVAHIDTTIKPADITPHVDASAPPHADPSAPQIDTSARHVDSPTPPHSDTSRAEAAEATPHPAAPRTPHSGDLFPAHEPKPPAPPRPTHSLHGQVNAGPPPRPNSAGTNSAPAHGRAAPPIEATPDPPPLPKVPDTPESLFDPVTGKSLDHELATVGATPHEDAGAADVPAQHQASIHPASPNTSEPKIANESPVNTTTHPTSSTPSHPIDGNASRHGPTANHEPPTSPDSEPTSSHQADHGGTHHNTPTTSDHHAPADHHPLVGGDHHPLTHHHTGSSTPDSPVTQASGHPDPPDFAESTIDDRKISGYLMNPEHPVGKAKLHVINSRTGLGPSDSEVVKRQIFEGVHDGQPIVGKLDEFGQRWNIDIELSGPKGTMTVRTAWIVRPGSTEPSLVTVSFPPRSRG